MIRFTLLGWVAAATVALGTISSQAAPITGPASFDLMGSLRAVTASTFDQATGLNFGLQTSSGLDYTQGYGTVTLGGAVNSVFTAKGFTVGSTGTAQNITNLSTNSAPIKPFYVFTSGSNTLEFDLTAITYIIRTAANPAFSVAPSLNIYGTGILSLTGYDPTPGTFSLTTSNTGNGMSATFQSSVIAQAVPEPASLSLFGIGLAGIVAGLRRRRAIASKS